MRTETGQKLEGIVFDYSVLLVDERDTRLLSELRAALETLKALGLKLVVFSTNPQPIQQRLKKRGLPPVDCVMTKADVLDAKGVPANKGSGLWLERAAEELGVETYQLAYIGDGWYDWLMAGHAAVFYLHANWAAPLPPKMVAYVADEPADVLGLVTHFLLLPPRWEFTLDQSRFGLCVRSLYSALDTLPRDRAGRSFNVKDVFTYGRAVPIGEEDARDLLMLHAVSSLYLEGLIKPYSLFAVYPSSTPGQTNRKIQGFLEPVSKLFHGYFQPDLLVRAVQGKDTSLYRWRGRSDEVSYLDQTNTGHLNPEHASKIGRKNRTVLVFDDFTTTGRTLDWARNLLYAAGAGRVVLLTVGKYPSPYLLHLPREGECITPFEHTTYTRAQFHRTAISMDWHPEVKPTIQQSFEGLAEGDDYPIEAL
jgi:predicted HAD superfamily phosphohydrolase YqeG